MRPSNWTERLPAAVALVAGVSLGASAFFGGYFDLTSWGCLSLVWLAVFLGLALGSPAMPRGTALAAVGGLLLLAAWAFISIGWAESVDQALEEANRWLLFAVILATLLLLLRARRLERPLLIGAVAPSLALAGYLLVKMAAGDADSLFLTNRLSEPFGYVNGLAAFLLLGFWPLIAVAERSGNRLLAGGGVAGAVMLVGLAVMTQSRGALLGFAVSAVVLIGVVPGRARRGWALVLVGAAVGACAGPLSDVVASLPPGAEAPSESDVRSVAYALAASGAAAGLLWVLAVLGAGVISRRVGEDRARLASAGLIVALALVGLVAVSLPVDRRVDEVRDQYDAFTQLRPVGDGVRFASGGGNRYDYWRVAVDQFEGHPARGEGAGNFDADYFRDRRTDENIRQAHSVELQVLGELGMVGAAALLLFVGGVLAGLWRRARPGRDATSPGLTVAAGGAFLVWLGQTSVDWLHIVPGLTGVAMCAAAVLVGPDVRGLPEARGLLASRRGVAAAIGVGIAVMAAALLVALPTLAAREQARGEDQLRSDPEEALGRAQDSLALNDEALPAYYLEAAALARLGDYDGARASLLEASEREPSDFVTWALIGDLAARRGDLDAAQRAYTRASRLNPRDQRLLELAASQRAIAAFAGGG